MTELLQKLDFYLQYPFVRHALIVGALISLCASLLGVTLVLRRLSLIGEGLSHAAFGLSAVAGALNLTDDLFIVLPGTILASILLLTGGQDRKVRGDAAVAIISVGALALGYLVMNLFPPSSNVAVDVCTTLFGSTSILTLTKTDVWLCIIISLVVILAFVFLYHRIFAVTFDETFAQATGLRTNLYNLLIALITALVIVLAMNLVGSLLISALIIFPALSAMRLFKTFRAVIVCSAVLSVVCAVVGILVSILASTPVGATIVSIDIVAFVVCLFTGRVLQ